MSRSLKLIITFQKGIWDDTYINIYAKSFFEELSEFFQDETYDFDVTKPRNIDLDNIYKAELFEIEVILKFSVQKTYRQVCAKIIQDWCNPEINKLSKLWLRIADPLIIENNGKLHHSDIQLKQIAFGTFPDMQHFMQHYHYESFSDEKELMATFNHGQRKVSLFTCFNHDPKWKNKNVHNKFEFNYRSIFQVIVNYVSQLDLVEVYFHLYHTPLLFVEKKSRHKEVNNNVLASDQKYQAKSWDRVLDFGCTCRSFQCSIERIGKCPVFKIIIPKKHKTYDIIERLMQRCPTNTLFHFATVKSLYSQFVKSLEDFETFPMNIRFWHLISDKSIRDDIKFKCQYAWEVVHGKSCEIKDQILLKYEYDPSREHWETFKNKLKSYFTNSEVHNVIDALIKSFYDIGEMIHKKAVFVFVDALDKLFKHYLKENKSEVDDDIPDGMCLIRRVILTPSKIIYLQPSVHFDNRIIREYDAEHSLRISIQDDNFQKLTFAVQYLDRDKKDHFLTRVVRKFLLEGIHIGPRKYEVLASSNSQLREHGIYMYAEDNSGNTAESIREWMGDFSHINNVAKYMARMGQCFSTSDESAQIEIKEEEIVNEPDVMTECKKYTFSDGVGLLSKKLAKKVRKSYTRRNSFGPLDFTDLYDPSAFQIRFQGCKGMLAETTLYSGRKIGIRKSMRKFPCQSSNVLEIVKISAPRAVFLNRPLITILENLGVEPGVFLDLQKKMVFDLTDSLIYEKKAHRMLQNNTSLEYPFKKFTKAGVSVTQEPFFRSVLFCVYKSLIGNLKRKARIAIPPEYGRNMLGIMDETGTLEYGQIFAQYSEEVGLVKSETKILKGLAVVTKNPCMHPGDVRKFNAVDVPELHHIKDCIVFPAKGKRPHPDEMAGSDLDGDEYVVIWEPNLIFPKENYEPMDFPANEEEKLDRPIEVADMIDFLCKYIEKDSIGIMANAFLAWADYCENGIFSKVCKKIALKYPQALDFAKSGTTQYLKADEKPTYYPDFMEKGSGKNSYKSAKTLGCLYRAVRNLEASVSNINSIPQAEVDLRFEYPGWEMFQNLAMQRKAQYFNRVKNILKKNGVKSESEALTGFIDELNEYNQNKYDSDNLTSLSKKYMFDTIKRYRLKFFNDCHKKEKKHNLSMNEIKYRMASAWYMVTYKDTETPFLSFPWVVSDVLLEIVNKYNEGRKTISENTFIQSSDKDLLSNLTYLHINDTCQCRVILHSTMFNWMQNSAFILTTSPDDVFCNDCFSRIIEKFTKVGMSCCSERYGGLCNCEKSCSPTKLVLKCFNFYASEVVPEIGMCSSGNCEGFQDLNLQSLALKTYAVIAVTQSLQQINLNNISDDGIQRGDNEEGDPIRICVTEELKEILTGRVDDVRNILKSLSGVKQVHIDGTPEKNGYYILVQAIGKAFNRWNLEELIMDEKCPSVIKSRLNKS